MAYFSNGTEGMVFDEQCMKCCYGEDPCPIAYLQYTYNYKVVKNKLAKEMLDYLVSQNGTCKMFETFKKDFEIDSHQTDLFNSKDN